MSENKNVFEQLRDENEAKFKDFDKDVKKNIDGQKDIWSFFGEIIELYIPKILSVLLGGASTDAKTNNFKEKN